MLPLANIRRNHARNRQREYFVRAMQQDLLQRALAPWPRRQAPLLEVNCGDGAFLPLLWRSGFDLVATENNALLRARAMTRNGRKFEIHAASADYLPFAEDNFDWGILHLRLSGQEQIESQVREILRVSKRGIMIAFWNRLSLGALSGFSAPATAGSPDMPVNPFKLWNALRRMGIGRTHTLSTLWFLPSSWSLRCPIARINGWLSGLPAGAWCITRVDTGNIYPLTPLALFWKRALRKPQPALEYTQKLKNFRR